MFNILKKSVSLSVVMALLSVILYSCSTDTVYHENVLLPSEGWDKNHPVVFNVNISDSINSFEFGLNIRNTTSYRYSNLYLFLITEFPNGNISRDTLECILANNEGKWLGKGWGDIKENDIVLKSSLRFPLTGEYIFRVQQAMRVDTLTGINDIGLSIIKE